MNFIDKLRNRTEGIINAIIRFPLTVVFLIIISIINSMMINDNRLFYDNYLLALTIGVFFTIVSIVIYERFFIKYKQKVIISIITLAITILYYYIFLNVDHILEETGIRTMVIIFSLSIAFLWIPSIKSVVTFNKSFMAGFKAFFTSVFYSGVIMLGMILIFAATDTLLFEVDEDIYMHTANIVFVVFATIYFLSLIPNYPGEKDYQESDLVVEEKLNKIEKLSSYPKFLEILLSYIVIPLASIFTMILLIYIVINISGSFWKDDLLEVMLVSYIVVVIVIYILTSRINNNFTILFRKIFPKILIIIVLFQTTNSIMRIGLRGLTYGRYYVILFGIFALISGIIFSIKPVKKNGLVPMVLIICIIISLVPFIDVFSISKRSQIAFLENTLEENNMLVDNKIIINKDIDAVSKERIIESLQYLDRMGYSEDIIWLDKEFDYYNDFGSIFGFMPYVSNYDREDKDINLYMKNDDLIEITGYDFIIETFINYSDNIDSEAISYEIEKTGEIYNLNINNGDGIISLFDSNDNLIINVKADQIIKKYKDYGHSYMEISIDEAQLIFENEKAAVKMVIQHLDIYNVEENNDFDAGIYLMIKIK
jgi:hypothetical protein